MCIIEGRWHETCCIIIGSHHVCFIEKQTYLAPANKLELPPVDNPPVSTNRPAFCCQGIGRHFIVFKKSVLEPLSEHRTRTNMPMCSSMNISAFRLPKTQHVVMSVRDCRRLQQIMYPAKDIWFLCLMDEQEIVLQSPEWVEAQEESRDDPEPKDLLPHLWGHRQVSPAIYYSILTIQDLFQVPEVLQKDNFGIIQCNLILGSRCQMTTGPKSEVKDSAAKGYWK